MKNFTLKTSLFVFGALLSITANAQQKPFGVKKFGKPVTELVPCGTTQYEALLKKKNPNRQNKGQFEAWIAPKVAQAKSKRLQKDGNNNNEVVTIPVVFHVIHNGSPVGTNENIADGQLLSQIEVLNEDFRKLEGSNGFNDNPVGADMEINFCLAKQNPDGVLSTGIVRYELGNGFGWTMEEAEIVKTQTQWDPEKYLNIWVFDVIHGLGGYAQFPTASGLDGFDLPGLATAANTDGVAMSHNFVGSSEKYPEGVYWEGKDLGRTVSHEVGHFFGLRHIWGDGDMENCDSGTDYCADTPTSLTPNDGCPVGVDSCVDDLLPDMIENYMDYTDDACLNIFTLNQKDRMQAVLLNSPRRLSLITSPGCVPGVILENDGSLQINPVETEECNSSTLQPEVVLTNTGTVALTSATIVYHINDDAEATYNWTGNLAVEQSATITLPEIEFALGSNMLYASIVTVNGVEDTAPSNDNKSIVIEIANIYTTSSLTVTITTDDFGDETLWGLATVDADEPLAGNIDPENIWNSDFYESNQTYIINVPITEAGCYIFGVFDLAADGMCCTSGEGHYKIETAEGIVIAEGGEFEDFVDVTFTLNLPTAGINEVNKLHNIKLYPNPAHSILNISVADETNMPESYTIYNSLGQIMDNGAITSTLEKLDISKYATGVYFAKLAKDGEVKTIQFVKN